MAEIGLFQLVGKVASTTSGAVWKARDPNLGRFVALKQVSQSWPLSVAGLAAEAHTLAALDHPNIVAVYDAITENDQVWLVEQWIEGAPLQIVAQSAGRLSPAQAIGVVRGALLGLAYAHEHDVVHGDVSPTNILVDGDGTAKLIDFGLAGPSGRLAVAGTPGYSSPEVNRGEGVTARSDVYSAGAVLVLLLRGAPLFSGATASEVTGAQLRAGPSPSLSGLVGDVAAVLHIALAADPAERYANGREFLTALEAAAEHDHGPDWLTHAGVAGLVAGAGTATLAVASSAGTTATTGLAAPVLAAGARSLPKRLGGLVSAGVGTAVVLGVAIAVGIHLHGNKHPHTLVALTTTPAVTAVVVAVPTSAPATTPAPTTPSPPTTTFTGRYRFTETFVRATGSDLQFAAKLSKPVHSIWTVTNICTNASACRVTVSSTSGATFALKSTGGLNWGRTSVYPHNHCYYVDRPTVIYPGSFYNYTITQQFSSTGTSGVAFTGHVTEADGRCSGPVPNQPGTIAWKFTLTKIA
jgi:hypothetical protein